MTFLCKGEIHYDWHKKVSALSPEDYAAFRKTVWDGKMPEQQSDLEGFTKTNWRREGILDDTEVSAWNQIGVEVTIHRIKGLASNTKDPVQTIYQISVANVGLMQVQQVEFLEDACTDDLQTYLDDGWRILAVCPPNDTRRPTYIIGHTEKGKRG